MVGCVPTACTDLGTDAPRPWLIPSWPGLSLGRTHISEIALAINALTAGGERSPAVVARLVRAICRGTDGLNPGHRSPLSGASLCRLQYRYEMCVRPRDKPGHDDSGDQPSPRGTSQPVCGAL